MYYFYLLLLLQKNIIIFLCISILTTSFDITNVDNMVLLKIHFSIFCIQLKLFIVVDRVVCFVLKQHVVCIYRVLLNPMHLPVIGIARILFAGVHFFCQKS